MRDILNKTKSPLLMGILNITPDSFYDGGKHSILDNIIPTVENMISNGADIIDIGGESSRPGSSRVSAQEELDRVSPVVEVIRSHSDIPISIDTMKSDVIKSLLSFNIQIVNDISSLNDEKLLDIIIENNLSLSLMHMQGMPNKMQHNPQYDDVVNDVSLFLKKKVNYCISRGLNKDQIIIDPGFGFGKTLDHNYKLLSYLKNLSDIHHNILIGISRKSMIGNLLNKKTDDRLYGSLAATVISIINNAKIIRTHDVYETKLIIKIIQELVG